MAQAETSVTPMMIGMSTRWIACQASWPMPGQPKTLSTTTTPRMKMPMSMPIMAMIGRMALGSAWPSSTRRRRQPLGAGGADIVLAQHVDHRGAHHARIPAGAEDAEGERRQDQMGEGAVAADREPAELHGEDVEQQEADDELRRRDADEGERHQRLVERGCRA